MTRRSPVDPPRDLLTAREKEVLEHVARDQTNQEIADALGISIYTVKALLRKIHEKLGVSTRGGAVAAAIRKGLIAK
ncbi:LuxR C-terminal-related transcriptional regulator [Pendulispora rubella]|uniref:LuxR C-terminal-related transcriptional regulator n=1 Tax=Pendulispora rubella TaxID=2741070 RepID=A0ABZ2KTY3_9BACT